MKFYIDPAFLTDIVVRKVYNAYAGKKSLTDDELVEVLKGKGIMTSTGSIDHPEFTKLREQLGTDGYIKIERGWWNGDRVLIPFYLNDVKFPKDEKFCCAAAMKFHIEYEQKHKKK